VYNVEKSKVAMLLALFLSFSFFIVFTFEILDKLTAVRRLLLCILILQLLSVFSNIGLYAYFK